MKRQIKDAIYSHLSLTAKALSAPKRIEIIDLLSQGEKSVEDIASHTDQGIKNTSAHLKELKFCRLIESRRAGKYVLYRLADSEVSKFWITFRTFGESRYSEIENSLKKALSVPEILDELDRKTLLARLKKGEVHLVDVRPSEEYNFAHLPYAVSVPPSEVLKHLKDLPKDKEIVAYCRGPYCFFAKEAVKIFRKNGFKAYVLRDSVQDWKSMGFPIACQTLESN